MDVFVILDESSGHELERAARCIDEAVEDYVREHEGEGWSDRFEVSARRPRDRRWSVFTVNTRTEFVVEVGSATLGRPVERGAQ